MAPSILINQKNILSLDGFFGNGFGNGIGGSN
jgi:hypothetical protein